MRPLSKPTDTALMVRRRVSGIVDRPTAFLVNRPRLSDRGSQEVFIPNLRETSGRDPEAVHKRYAQVTVLDQNSEIVEEVRVFDANLDDLAQR